MKIQVKDIMTSPVSVVEGTISVGEIKSLMKVKDINALPVVYQLDEGVEIRGIITATDFCSAVDDSLPIEEVKRFTRVYVVSPNASCKSAADMMLKHHVHHLVVMNDGQLVGMVSSLDFVKLVSEFELTRKINSVV